MVEYRTQSDALGPVQIPVDAPWGPQTQRSLGNFKIGDKMPLPVIKALLNVKSAAAHTNQALANYPSDRAHAVEDAVEELLNQPNLRDFFPLVIYQTGSGTQTNMNVNEVIAHTANQRNPNLNILPNDDVNQSQSSNDTFPTAMQIAAVQAILPLKDVLSEMIATLKQKETEFSQIVKIGRTHLQDAVPLTFGQEISGWRNTLEHDLNYLNQNLSALYELPIGGTAVGTQLNTPIGFDQAITKVLASRYKMPFVPSINKFQGLTSHSSLNLVHGILRTLASDLVKIGNDIRFLASGPRAGYDELNIPANEPGSSIMPGKVNPTQIEALTMVAATVMGHDVTLNFAASQGNFELNVYKPVIIATFLDSAELLTEAISSVNTHLLKGLTVNEKRMQALVDQSLMLVTALSPHIGYEASAQIAQTAQTQNITLKQAALASQKISESEYAQWIQPLQMTNIDRMN